MVKNYNKKDPEVAGLKFGEFTLLGFSHWNYDKTGRRSGYYVNAKCSCGIVKTVKIGHLRSGSTKSCGCSRNGEPYKSALNMIWRQYTREGKKRGIRWDLSREDFESLLSLPCFYCERIPSRKYGSRFFQLGGIDRFNNNIGYQKDNCVPCCRLCNMAKKSGTISDFKDWVVRINNNMSVIEMLLDVDKGIEGIKHH